MPKYRCTIHDLADPTATTPVDPSMEGDVHALLLYERKSDAPATPEVMIESGETMTKDQGNARFALALKTPYCVPIYGIALLNGDKSSASARAMLVMICEKDVWRLRTLLWKFGENSWNILQRLAEVLLPQHEKGEDARRKFLRFFPEDAPLAALVFFPDDGPLRFFVHEGVSLNADGDVVTQDGEVLTSYQAAWESRPPYRP